MTDKTPRAAAYPRGCHVDGCDYEADGPGDHDLHVERAHSSEEADAAVADAVLAELRAVVEDG